MSKQIVQRFQRCNLIVTSSVNNNTIEFNFSQINKLSEPRRHRKQTPWVRCHQKQSDPSNSKPEEIYTTKRAEPEFAPLNYHIVREKHIEIF